MCQLALCMQSEVPSKAEPTPPARGEWLWARVAGRLPALQPEVLRNAVRLCLLLMPAVSSQHSVLV